jgi:hypothetical protein
MHHTILQNYGILIDYTLVYASVIFKIQNYFVVS